MLTNYEGPSITIENEIIGNEIRVNTLRGNLLHKNPTSGDEKAQHKAPMAK